MVTICFNKRQCEGADISDGLLWGFVFSAPANVCMCVWLKRKQQGRGDTLWDYELFN